VLRVTSFTVLRRWSDAPGAPPLHSQPQPRAEAAAPSADCSSAERPLCKFWLNTGRCAAGDRCAARHVRDKHALAAWVGERRALRAAVRAASAAQLLADEEQLCGEAAAKSQRADLFAAWLVRRFGAEALRSGRGVLDVAGGGAGGLSFFLSVVHGVPCTVVDPRPPHLSRRQRRLLEAATAAAAAAGAQPPCLPRHEPRMWEAGSWGELLPGASAVVGMHPDGATDGIVQAALAAGLPGAVVPCCVFPNLFTARRLAGGARVRSREELVAHLLEKAGAGARLELLPFEGANACVWWPGKTGDE